MVCPHAVWQTLPLADNGRFSQGRRSGRPKSKHTSVQVLEGTVLRLPLYAAACPLELWGHFCDSADKCSADDESNNLNITIEESQHVSAKTTWTLLLYLTSAADGCKGGETVFYPHDRPSAKEEIAVPPETGMLLLHKHGDDCMLVGLGLLMLPMPPCERISG